MWRRLSSRRVRRCEQRTLGIENVALVGLSGGGKLALDVASANPERVWAVAHIAAPVSGIPWGDELEAAYAGADTPEKELEADLKGHRSAPRTSIASSCCRHGRVTPKRQSRRPSSSKPCASRHSCSPRSTTRGHCRTARLVEIDSDHYLTLREPELVTKLLRGFFAETIAAR